jgi:inorganic pyrophosphatase
MGQIRTAIGVLCLSLLGIFCCRGPQRSDIADGCEWIDDYTIVREGDYLQAYPALNPDGTVNVVVEIPAGTQAKWEVNATLPDGSKPTDGKLRWEFKNGEPRVVDYLSYPANYGLIPGTCSGDGDALDIILIGDALPRGAIIKARHIGVLRMLDNSEQDDKLIGVYPGSHFYTLQDLEELNQHYPGVTDILAIWFCNYKGSAVIKLQSWGNRQIADEILKSSISIQ